LTTILVARQTITGGKLSGLLTTAYARFPAAGGLATSNACRNIAR
jgi:hypothetical protein